MQGSGYDVMILGLKEEYKGGLIESLDGREYATLCFYSMESLDSFIKLLQDTKKLWEKEEQNGKEKKER